MSTVSAIIRRADTVLLVGQQRPTDEREYWCLPGGRVEPGESLADALQREIQEETGLLTIKASGLAWVCAATWSTADERGEGFSFVFEVPDPGGNPESADPDAIVREATFVPIDQAIEKLRDLPVPRMRDPAIAYLEGRAVPGTVFAYDLATDAAEDVLTSVVPSLK